VAGGSFAACGGAVVSLSGDQPSDGDGGIPGFGTADAQAVSAAKLTCEDGAVHANICCKFELDGGLSCGEWISTPLASCPDGYAQYEDPVMCCTNDGCEPGIAEDGGDGGMLHVIDAGSSSSCPAVCPSGWPTPDGHGCCASSSSGYTCDEGQVPPVFDYPVFQTFGDAGVGVPLACPAGSTASPDGLGCCTVNADGYQVCGELGGADDLGEWGTDAGNTGSTLGLMGDVCTIAGVCCGPNAAPTRDHFGCCTADSQDFTLCIRFADPATYDAGPGWDGGILPGAHFYSGSVVPWPWSPNDTAGGCYSH
jgi:hypothetical protein